MSLAYQTDGTVPAYPLGVPADGRARFGMTPSMARLYRWLVLNRPHEAEFVFDMRGAAADLGWSASSVQCAVVALIERGWLDRVNYAESLPRFALVAPVKLFRECTAHD